jgi:2-polyprenyl-3-methyl-5-hydroxy-6-metoxy-1,4-benzoquinol methylase
MLVETNWWETFFEGPAVKLWLDAIPSAQTEREAESLIEALNLPAGASLLDVPCGGGRLALALARRGYHVTGVDWSSEFLVHARTADAGNAVTWERRDMRDLAGVGHFDGAFCVGNSFGYMDDEGNAAFLRAIAATLKPGGRFVLETPMTIEGLLPHLQPRPWWKAGDTYLLAANTFDPVRSRLDIEYTFIASSRVDVRRGSHRVYSVFELLQLLEACGLHGEIDRSAWSGATVPQLLRVIAVTK